MGGFHRFSWTGPGNIINIGGLEMFIPTLTFFITGCVFWVCLFEHYETIQLCPIMPTIPVPVKRSSPFQYGTFVSLHYALWTSGNGQGQIANRTIVDLWCKIFCSKSSKCNRYPGRKSKSYPPWITPEKRCLGDELGSVSVTVRKKGDSVNNHGPNGRFFDMKFAKFRIDIDPNFLAEESYEQTSGPKCTSWGHFLKTSQVSKQSHIRMGG